MLLQQGRNLGSSQGALIRVQACHATASSCVLLAEAVWHHMVHWSGATASRAVAELLGRAICMQSKEVRAWRSLAHSCQLLVRLGKQVPSRRATCSWTRGLLGSLHGSSLH